jgi:hypothetical protein
MISLNIHNLIYSEKTLLIFTCSISCIFLPIPTRHNDHLKSSHDKVRYIISKSIVRIVYFTFLTTKINANQVFGFLFCFRVSRYERKFLTYKGFSILYS